MKLGIQSSHFANIGEALQPQEQPPLISSLAQRDAKLVAEALKNLLGIVRCSGNRHLIATVETNIEHLLKRAEGHQ